MTRFTCAGLVAGLGVRLWLFAFIVREHPRSPKTTRPPLSNSGMLTRNSMPPSQCPFISPPSPTSSPGPVHTIVQLSTHLQASSGSLSCVANCPRSNRTWRCELSTTRAWSCHGKATLHRASLYGTVGSVAPTVS